MSETKVSAEQKEKIVTAANVLVAEGVNDPTNLQVRNHLGKGSLAHISPVMREWRESRKADNDAAFEMPSALRKTVETVLGQLWTTATKLASTEVEAVRQESSAAIEMANTERDEALDEIQRLEARIEEQKEVMIEKNQAFEGVQNELAEKRAANAKLVSENAALKTRMEGRDEQINGLKHELKESRENHKALEVELLKIARQAAQQGERK